MPALGMAQDTGKVLRWIKVEGESVLAGEPILEIETDKAVVEIEAPASGVLARVSAQAGEDVPVGQEIALILGEGDHAALPAAGATPSTAEKGPDRPTPQAAEGRLAARGGSTGDPAPTGDAIRAPASPKARRLAAERGIDLPALGGSGPGGAVLASDLPAATARTEEEASQDRVSNVWRLMAERVSQTWTRVPHFYLTREARADGLLAWKQRTQAGLADSVTYSDLLVRICAAALVRHPEINVVWQEDRVRRLAEINVGLAVAVDDGLVVPVIHRANRLTLGEIASRRRQIVERAQAGRLRADDLEAGTFTISNLGMFGVDAFHAILNAPQAAILAVGRIAERVIAVASQPAVVPTLFLGLSCDHRAIDGARGARFLQTLAALIEDPSGLEG